MGGYEGNAPPAPPPPPPRIFIVSRPDSTIALLLGERLWHNYHHFCLVIPFCAYKCIYIYIYIWTPPPPVPRCCCHHVSKPLIFTYMFIELMHLLQGHFVDQKNKAPKNQNKKNTKPKKKKKKKTILAPTMAGIPWFLVFCFFGPGKCCATFAQHERICEPCERRRVLGERICEFSVEKSY